LVIVEKEEQVKDKKKQIVRARPGDNPPSRIKSWGKLYKGHLYGQPLLIRLRRWITCKLHCRLRLTSGVVKHLIVSKFSSPAQRDALWDLWALGGVAVRKALLEKEGSDAAKNQFKRFAVSGNDEEKLVTMLEASLDIIYPPRRP